MIVLLLLTGIIGLYLAKNKGYNAVLGFLLGFLLTFVGIIIVAILPERTEPTAAKARPSRASKEKTGAKKKAGAKRKPNAAFMKPMNPGAALHPIVGNKPLPRTEVTKKLWAYIKKNKLQDQKNKRMINADATLKQVFGGKAKVNMFEMTKLVGKHLK